MKKRLIAGSYQLPPAGSVAGGSLSIRYVGESQRHDAVADDGPVRPALNPEYNYTTLYLGNGELPQRYLTSFQGPLKLADFQGPSFGFSQPTNSYYKLIRLSFPLILSTLPAILKFSATPGTILLALSSVSGLRGIW